MLASVLWWPDDDWSAVDPLEHPLVAADVATEDDFLKSRNFIPKDVCEPPYTLTLMIRWQSKKR